VWMGLQVGQAQDFLCADGGTKIAQSLQPRCHQPRIGKASSAWQQTKPHSPFLLHLSLWLALPLCGTSQACYTLCKGPADSWKNPGCWGTDQDTLPSPFPRAEKCELTSQQSRGRLETQSVYSTACASFWCVARYLRLKSLRCHERTRVGG
jgi:hypothetical protein